MNYYKEIKNKIIDNETYERVKDYSKERHRVITYYEIGKLLNEAGGKYGDNIINEYSKKLVVEVGKKYNRRTLFRMLQFYRTFSNEKVSTLSTQLGDTYHKIDLLLFNIKYNAYVVVELKVSEFKVEYISQVQKYMNYIDKNIKEISNNSTIGILICKRENKYVIEYCSDERIVVRKYVLT